ncbi:MAG: CBS domain-containing protein [Thaumarchaeota archaeon]|nr:CBS domain-containing protein [Nitrososphaerota archaeon]
MLFSKLIFFLEVFIEKKYRLFMLLERPILLTSVMKKAITASPKMGLVDALGLLYRYGIKRLVVVDGNRPVGIVTEKDLARATSTFNGRDIGEMRVGEIMSENLIAVGKNNSIYDCAKLMRDNKISSVIVANADGTLGGIITKTDLVGVFLINDVTGAEVSNHMHRKVVTVAPKDLLFVVQSVLVNNRISRVVVAQKNRPVGIITYRDFLPAKTANWIREYEEPDDLAELKADSRFNEFNVNSLDHAITFRAEDIMTRNPVVINKNEFLFQAALLMVRNRVSGLPVVHNDLLAGIITKTDIVNSIADM